MGLIRANTMIERLFNEFSTLVKYLNLLFRYFCQSLGYFSYFLLLFGKGRVKIEKQAFLSLRLALVSSDFAID